LKNKNYNKIWIYLVVALSFTSVNAEVLNFSKVYDLALVNSNDLKSAGYQVQSKEETVNQAESQLYPQINFSGYYKKSDQTYNSNYSSNTEHIRQSLISYTLSAKQPIYNQSIYSKISTEKTRVKLYNSKLELQKQLIAQDVFKAYLDVLKSVNKIKLDESYLEYVDSKLETLNKQYAVHLVNKMDLLEMKIEQNSATIDLSKEKKLLDVNKLKLKQFIGEVDFELPVIQTDTLTLENIQTMRNAVANGSDNILENLNVKQAELAKKISSTRN
jgi:outer membrane protein